MSKFLYSVTALMTKGLKAVINSSFWIFCVGLAAIIVAIATVMNWPVGDKSSTASIHTSAPAAGRNSQNLLNGNSAVSPTINAGTCLSGDRATVPCDTAHAYEIFAAGSRSCSQQLLVSYLGGVFSLDVLDNQVRMVPINLSGGTACALTAPPGTIMSTTARDVLTTSRGDVFRECIDHVREIDVPCSEPHSSEVVYVAVSDSSAEVDCGSKAAQYMGTDPLQLARDLKVSLAKRNGQLECQVDVLGHNVLTSSIRRLGTQAVPISSLP